MIIEHTIIGSKETSFHTFQINVSKMNLLLSNGSYFQDGKEIFTTMINSTILIPSVTELTYYEVWLTMDGISILTRKLNEEFGFDQLVNPIDRLCWFAVPVNCTDLSTIDIDFIKVVEQNAN
jgi:hypothetical protein